MSGRRQIGLCALAALVALLDLAPVELQRRLIDDAITPGDLGMLWRLALIYGGIVLLHQAAKAGLRLAQARTAESAALHTRGHALGQRIEAADRGEDDAAGRTAVVLGADVDKLAGFVGRGPSDAVAAGTLLLAVAGYMLWTEPRIALVAALLLAPQALVAPVFQRRVNRLTHRRVRLVRELGERAGEDREALRRVRRLLPRVYVNRMALAATKAAMKAALNLLNQFGPLAALAFGGWLAVRGETTVGVVVAFLSAFQRAAGPVRELVGFYRRAEVAAVQHRLVAEWMTAARQRRDDGGEEDPADG